MRSAEASSASLSLEKKERIEQALDKFIDIVSPLPTPTEPQTDSMLVEETNIKEKNPSPLWEDWEQVCTDNYDRRTPEQKVAPALEALQSIPTGNLPSPPTLKVKKVDMTLA